MRKPPLSTANAHDLWRRTIRDTNLKVQDLDFLSIGSMIAKGAHVRINSNMVERMSLSNASQIVHRKIRKRPSK